MTAQPLTKTMPRQAQFFGLNVGSLWRDLLSAWRGMLGWSLFSWLRIELPVRLRLPSGGQLLALSLGGPAVPDEGRAKSAKFEAVVLPEECILRRMLEFPALQPSELEGAVKLEIQSISPFPLDDLSYTYGVNSAAEGRLQIHIVLTSRKIANQSIAAIHHQEPDRDMPEVWVPSGVDSGYLMLPGFGEARRQQQMRRWRWAGALLVLLTLMVLVAISITPTIQLFERARQAGQAMVNLQTKSGPALRQREDLVRTSEKLASLVSLTGSSVAPIQALKVLTDALADDTSLLSLQIQGNKVSISGQTPNASALMKQLDGTPGLRDVKAPVPATKPLGVSRESFTIEFTIDHVKLKPLA